MNNIEMGVVVSTSMHNLARLCRFLLRLLGHN